MPRVRERKQREPLSRERIEDAALDLIDREGLSGFSTRKLAAALSCEAMSIYHYFPSRTHLIDALVDRFLLAVGVADPALPPVERLKRLAHDYRAAAHRFSGLYEVIATHRLNTLAGIRFIDGVLRIFADLGFDIEMRARLLRIWGYYLNGAALDETMGYGKGPTAAEPVPEEDIRRDHPDVAAVNPYFKPPHYEATFELGLAMLFDGLEKLQVKAARAERGPAREKRGRRTQTRFAASEIIT